MQVMMDIVGSTIIGGAILFLVFKTSDMMTDLSFQNTLDVATQSNSRTIADMINYDFYKIGYHESVTGPRPIIEIADSDRIRFRSDIDNNGTVDTVEYSESAPYEVAGSASRFRVLYRNVISSARTGANVGLTSFQLSYYDTMGVRIDLPTPTDSSSLRRIQSIKIQMMIRNPMALDTVTASTLDTTFAATYWEKWISPKNLRVLK